MVHLRPALLSAEHCNKDMSCNVPNPHWSSYAQELQGPITKRKGRKQSKLTSKANLSPLLGCPPMFLLALKRGMLAARSSSFLLFHFAFWFIFLSQPRFGFTLFPKWKLKAWCLFDTGEQIKRTKFNQQSKHSIKATIIITTIMVNAVV